MNNLTIMKQKIYRLRSVAGGIGALALSTLMALSIGSATVLAQSAPTITLTPGEHSGRPTLKATASETVTGWEYLRSSSDFDCSGSTFDQYTPARDQAYIFVPKDQGDLTYCFRAKNSDDVYGYAKHRFDFNPPAVTNAALDSQPGKSILTLTVNEPVSSHYYVHSGTGCSETATTWSAQPTGLEVTVRKAVNICFQLTDDSGKVTYYLYKVTGVKPLVKPEVTVSYYADRNEVEATANTTVSSWAYVVSSSDLGTCDQVDYASPDGQTRTASYTPSSSNQHYYFQATDSSNQTACGKVIVLAAISNPNPTTTTPPTTTTTTTNSNQPPAPDIDIDASGRQITASHTEPVAQWRYYRSPGTPICSSDVVWDSAQNPSVVRGRQVTGLDDSDVGQWVCFRALILGTTYRGQEVYKAVRITNTWADPANTQTLNIRFEQSPTTLTAIASPSVPSSNFQYLAYSGTRYPNGPNCHPSNPHMTAEYFQRWNAKVGNVVNLVPAVEGYYYCFRVVDDQGGASYAMYRVGGIRAVKTQPAQNTQTQTQTTQQQTETENTEAAPVEIEVFIDQTSTTLKATANSSAASLTWQSLRFSSERYPSGPNCNSSNRHMTAEYWAKWNTGSSNTIQLTANDEGKFYCFRVVDSNGNVGLGQHKVTGVEAASQQPGQTEQAPSQTNQHQPPQQTQPTNPPEAPQAPVVNVVNTSPETPAPQVTVNPPQVTVTTQAPDSQPIPIDLTVNIPESSNDEAEAPEPEQEEDDSFEQGLIWGLGGAVITLIVLTAILAIVSRGPRR